MRKTTKYPIAGKRYGLLRGIRHCYKCLACGKRVQSIEVSDAQLEEIWTTQREQVQKLLEKIDAQRRQIEALQDESSRRAMRRLRFLLKQALDVANNT